MKRPRGAQPRVVWGAAQPGQAVGWQRGLLRQAQGPVAGGRYNQISIAVVLISAPPKPAFASLHHLCPDLQPRPKPRQTRLPAATFDGSAWLPALLCALLCLPLQPVQAADEALALRNIELQFRRGETQIALQNLEQGLQASPGDAGLRLLKAIILSESGRPSDAARLLEQLTQDFPELPEPYNNLAVLQAAAGRLQQARASLESALRLDPLYRTAHENLGDVLVRLALQAYQAAARNRNDAPLQTKLRLARELTAAR